VRTEFVSKPGIPYENGGPITLFMKCAVISPIDGIKPLPEVEAVEITVAWT